MKNFHDSWTDPQNSVDNLDVTPCEGNAVTIPGRSVVVLVEI